MYLGGPLQYYQLSNNLIEKRMLIRIINWLQTAVIFNTKINMSTLLTVSFVPLDYISC